MKAQLHGDGLGNVQEALDLSVVVVFDDFENPILIVKKIEQGQVVVYKPTDPEFPQVVKMLGLKLPKITSRKAQK